jgi:hypothetical protein
VGGRDLAQATPTAQRPAAAGSALIEQRISADQRDEGWLTVQRKGKRGAASRASPSQPASLPASPGRKILKKADEAPICSHLRAGSTDDDKSVADPVKSTMDSIDSTMDSIDRLMDLFQRWSAERGRQSVEGSLDPHVGAMQLCSEV